MKSLTFFILAISLLMGISQPVHAAVRVVPTTTPFASERSGDLASMQQSKRIKRLEKKAKRGRLIRSFLLFCGAVLLFLLAGLFSGFLAGLFFVGAAIAAGMSVLYFIFWLGGI